MHHPSPQESVLDSGLLSRQAPDYLHYEAPLKLRLYQIIPLSLYVLLQVKLQLLALKHKLGLVWFYLVIELLDLK